LLLQEPLQKKFQAKVAIMNGREACATDKPETTVAAILIHRCGKRINMNSFTALHFFTPPIHLVAVFSLIGGSTGLQSSFAAIAGALWPIAIAILGVSFLVLVHEFGHWTMARLFRMGTPVFCIGYGKREWCLILGTVCQTEFRIAPFLIGGGFVRITGTSDRGFDSFPLWQRIVVASAGIIFNISAAAMITFSLFHFIGSEQIRVTNTYVCALSDQVTVAREAGIRSGDIFVSVGDMKIIDASDLTRALQSNEDKPTKVVFSRNGEDVSVMTTPTASGEIGVVPGQHATRFTIKVPVVKAAYYSVTITTKILVGQFQQLGQLMGLVEKPADSPTDSRPVGAIGVIDLGAKSASKGVFDFLLFLVVMSMSLVFINILPLPLFDGGNLLYYLIEGVAGRPVSREIRAKAARLFLVLVIGFSGWALLNDLKHLFH